MEDEILWIRNPFEEEYLKKLKMSSSEEDSSFELSCDQILKSFLKTSLVPFWIKLRQEYPAIAKIALKHLMGFSTLVFLKNKYGNKLDVERDSRLKLLKLS
ncbi:hypothetical protein WA026_022041 [Henosepilachna vigintioctopunctata]|uniref:Uncharacterized protein n=1 Tax=Henosepilachna vigintioctopunctata TaxID=420089 RepID=A0AAW1V5H9_9CUCU